MAIKPIGLCTVENIEHFRRNKSELLEILKHRDICWSDIEERAARNCEVGPDHKASWCMSDAYYEELFGGAEGVMRRWRTKMLTSRPRTNLGEIVKSGCHDFLATDWAPLAAKLGWSKREVFGLGVGAGRLGWDRVDAEGLAVGLALSAHQLTITAMTTDEALLMTASGAKLRHMRRRTNFYAVPAWEHHALGSSVAPT